MRTKQLNRIHQKFIKDKRRPETASPVGKQHIQNKNQDTFLPRNKQDGFRIDENHDPWYSAVDMDGQAMKLC